MGLHDDLSEYQCCAGQYDWLPMECCYCRDSACPCCWLACEVVFFHPCSIMGTRMALQHEMQLENTCCDKFLLLLIAFVKAISCILKAVGCRSQAHACDALGDCIFTCVCGCIQTQNKLQLDYRDDPQKHSVVVHQHGDTRRRTSCLPCLNLLL